jgi:archaeosortase A (PGF-CTERM-specific)
MILNVMALLGSLTVLSFVLSYLFGKKKRKIYLRATGYALVTFSLILYIPYNIFVEQSIIESVLSFAGVILGLYFIKMIISEKSLFERTSLMILTTSVLLMFTYTVSPVQSFLIESVASETSRILGILGYETRIMQESGNTYIFFPSSNLKTKIVLACTGVGSIAIFVGLSISASSFSLKDRLGLAAFTSSVIYVLNIVRNVFIASAYGGQWLHIAPNFVSGIFGRGGVWVSYYVADRIIAQMASAIFLIIFAVFILSYIDDESPILDEWIVMIDEIVQDSRTVAEEISDIYRY